MKRIFALLITLVSLTAAAQETAPVKFGVNAGVTYANLRGNIWGENTPRFNFLAGVSTEVPLTEKFSIVANLNYERKTSREESPYAITDIEGFTNVYILKVNFRLEYITLPINLKYYIGPAKKFYVNGGPFASYFLSRTIKDNGKNVGSRDNGAYKSLDYGVNLGIGYNLALNATNNLNIELRDNYGLARVNNRSSRNFEGNSAKTNSVNLIVGWQFTL